MLWKLRVAFQRPHNATFREKRQEKSKIFHPQGTINIHVSGVCVTVSTTTSVMAISSLPDDSDTQNKNLIGYCYYCKYYLLIQLA